MAKPAANLSKPTAIKRVRKVVTSALATTAPAGPSACEIAMFVDGGGSYPGFKFIRYFIKGDGPLPSVKPLFEKKRRPGSDPVFGAAAKSEALIPNGAPTEYLDVDHLITRYEATHQTWEPNVLVQVNFYPEPGQTAQALYELVRAFCRKHFVADGCPVLLTLHVPALAGHDNEAHCHAQVLLRRLTCMGFGSWNRTFACDAGNRATYAAWTAHIDERKLADI